MNKVITISREFGSGGRELGVKLAQTLGSRIVAMSFCEPRS